MIKLLPQTRNKGLDAPREVTQNWKMVIGLPTRYTPFFPVIRRGSLCSGSAKGMIHWSAIPKKGGQETHQGRYVGQRLAEVDNN